MRNKRLIIALFAAVAFGLIAAISVSRYLASAQAYTKNLTNVVVAKVEIPIGTRIVPEQLSVLQFPKAVAPEGTFSTIDNNLIGRVAVVRIAVREPVTESRLAAVGVAGGLPSLIPDGYRAMTVKVDDVVGVSGFIQPGTLVDIVVTIIPPDNARQREKVSKIVLQNIKVLASGTNMDKPKNEKDTERVKAVTLQVTPEQAEKLALASSEGRLQLVMRNSVDQGDEKTPGANKSSLLAGDAALPVPEPGLGPKDGEKPKSSPRRPKRVQSSAPVTAKANTTAPAPPPRPSIEVIKGAKKENVDFP
jgi:pilus assembly protein CpaB